MGSGQKPWPRVDPNATVRDPRPPLPILLHKLNVTIILGGRGLQHRTANIANIFRPSLLRGCPCLKRSACECRPSLCGGNTVTPANPSSIWARTPFSVAVGFSRGIQLGPLASP